MDVAPGSHPERAAGRDGAADIVQVGFGGDVDGVAIEAATKVGNIVGVQVNAVATDDGTTVGQILRQVGHNTAPSQQRAGIKQNHSYHVC